MTSRLQNPGHLEGFTHRPTERRVRRPSDPPDQATRVSIQAESRFDPAGEFFGRYRLVRELGRGGMGVVWEAWDPELKRSVALKHLHESSRPGSGVDAARFAREARLAAKLKHPHILAVHDVGVVDGRPYFTADFIAGRSLHGRTCVDPDGASPLPLRQAVEWVRQVAEALQYAHDEGIVHRDIKPGNILIDEQGRPFVADFGLAKDVLREIEGAEATRLTVSGALLGTPSYMSPEQARGQIADLGPASDQFSLGVVLYELIAGRLPFEGETLWDLLHAIAEREPALPSRWNEKVHRDLETVCLKALEKDPHRRYPAMRDFAVDLARYLKGEPIQARPASAAMRLVRLCGKQRRLALPLALVLAAAALWAGLTVQRVRAESEIARARAEDRATRERDTKEKCYRVAFVMSRWAGLVPELREMERLHYASAMPPLERALRSLKPWNRTESVLGRLGPDSATQATALALRGWALWLAGHPEDALARMREATRVDADVPFGSLMEAFVLLSDELDEQQLPDYRYTDRGLEFAGAPRETPAMARRRRELDRLLAQAEAARVWGSEGVDEFRRMVAGIRAMQVENYAAAERELTAALAASDLFGYDRWIHLARARVRYLEKDFAGGLQDLALVARARPDQALLRFQMGLLLTGDASERTARGEDPTGRLEAACDRFGEAVAREPRQAAFYHSRALASYLRGLAAAERKQDPTEWFQAALADCAETIRRRPGDTDPLRHQGVVLTKLAKAERARGGDVDGCFERAAEAFNQALRLDPNDYEALHGRGIAFLERAFAEAYRGNDPLPWLERGRADSLDAAARAGIGDPPSRQKLAAEHIELARVYGACAACAHVNGARVKDEAFQLLEKGLELGYADRDRLENDPGVAPLRSDPRWAEVSGGK